MSPLITFLRNLSQKFGNRVTLRKPIKRKKAKNLVILSLSLSVGITGLEPATSRPPEATQLALNPVENQPYRSTHLFMSDGFRDGFTSRWVKLQYFNLSLDSFGIGTKVQRKNDIKQCLCNYLAPLHHFY